MYVLWSILAPLFSGALALAGPADTPQLEPGTPVTAVIDSDAEALQGGVRYCDYSFHLDESGPVTFELWSYQDWTRIELRSQSSEVLHLSQPETLADPARLSVELAAGEYVVRALFAPMDGVIDYEFDAKLRKAEVTTPEELSRRRGAWYERALEARLTPRRRLDVLWAAGIHDWGLSATDGATKKWEAALVLAREQGNTPYEAALLCNLYNPYMRVGERAKALDTLQESLRIYRRLRDTNGMSNALSNLSAYYVETGEYGRAVEMFHELLGQEDAQGVADWRGLVCGNLAGAYMYGAKFEEARKWYLEAITLYGLSGNHHGQAMQMGHLGALLLRLGEHDEAEVQLRSAMTILQKAGDRDAEAGAQSQLAYLAQLRGLPRSALEGHGRAYKLFRATGNRRGCAQELWKMGDVHIAIGDPAALDLLEDALEEALEIDDQFLQANILLSLGNLHDALHQYDRALEMYGRARDRYRDLGAEMNRAAVLTAMARTMRRVGSAGKAVESLRAAESIAKENGDRIVQTVARLEAGATLAAVGRYDDAIRELEAVRSTCAEMRIGHLRATTDTHLAQALLLRGDHGQAVSVADRALDYHRQVGSRQAEALALRIRGDAECQRGNRSVALGNYRDAFAASLTLQELVEVRFDGEPVSRMGSGELALSASRLFSLSLDFAAREKGLARVALLKEAIHTADIVRARNFLRVLRASEVRDLMNDAARELWERAQARRAELSAFLESNESSDANAASIKERNRAIAELERDCRRADPTFFQITDKSLDRDWTLERVLGSDEVLVYFARFDDFYVRFIANGEGHIETRELSLPAKEIDGQVARVVAAVEQRKPIESTRKLLGELRAMLLGESFEAERALIVPAAALHQVPFDALVLADGRYLVESCELRLSPSLAIAHRLAERDRRDPAVELVAIGDPAYRESGSTGKLVHARTELERVANHFESKILLTGQKASEVAFREHAGRGRILHVACHGRFVSERSPDHSARGYFRGGLLLSQSDGTESVPASSHHDGVLTAAEVLSLDLRAVDLAVLSACESAVGEIAGYEGKVGLERAFLTAGVRSIVGTLWRVDDRMTAEVMGLFHERLARGDTLTAALRFGKLSTLSKRSGAAEKASARGPGLVKRGETQTQHPYFWAGLVLSGANEAMGSGTGRKREGGTPSDRVDPEEN